MSEELTIANSNVLQVGGVGLGTGIFKAKPQYLELVQRTTRVEGAEPGKFRNTSTNEHFLELRVVLLDVPREQREYYDNSQGFSKDSKICFSIDNNAPHARAKTPQALYCANCPLGDVRWKKWRETHSADDLPKCQMFYSLVLGDRNTQAIYKMAVKGMSVMPFKNYMETAVAGLLQKIMADVRQKNKQRGYSFVPTKGIFVPTEGATPTEQPLPLPSIYDLSMTMYPTQREKGGVPVIGIKDVKLMSDADRAEFGALYLELTKRPAQEEEMSQAEAEFQAAKVATTQAPAPAVVLPGVPVQGEVLPKDAPITI